MNNRGKSINLFLMDGDVNGRIKCTLANWTGIAYKIPRTDLEKCKDREDLKQSGVYFLFGISDDSGEGVVYIGQAGARKNGEGILNRLFEHRRNENKDYWTEAIVFTTSNNSLGPTEISYLENRFCNLALETKRYEVKNANDPNSGNITEEKECEMEEFIDFAKVIIGTLGHKVFIPYAESSDTENRGIVTSDENMDEVLYFKQGVASGSGCRTSDGFVIFKGSKLKQKVVNSCPQNAVAFREKYKNRINKNYELTENVLVSSPSAAAAFLTGNSINGRECWYNRENKSLKQIEEMEVYDSLSNDKKNTVNSTNKIDGINLENLYSRDMSFKSMHPFVKWAGGKKQLLDKLSDRIPNKFGTYYEPFIGGGAMLFALRPETAVVSDVNEQLINTYVQLQNDAGLVIREVNKLDLAGSGKEYYLKLREAYNKKIANNELDAECAALMIWINKHCFNGLYRVNKKGMFNVPYNNKQLGKSIEEANIMSIGHFLEHNNIEIKCQDFEKTCASVKKDDFVYFDSPYLPVSETANFTDYTKDGFSMEDHRRLAALYRRLDSMGAKVMLSNHDVDLVYELYEGYKIEKVDVKRAINSDASKRTGKEVIITNYEV